MATIVEQLKKEIADRKVELKKLESALEALSGTGGKKTKASSASSGVARKGRVWTAEQKAEISRKAAERAAAKKASAPVTRAKAA